MAGATGSWAARGDGVGSFLSNDPLMGNPVRYGFNGVVAKPYDVTDLG